ncbi:MAG TPA: DUF4376 domain-containing protein [Methanomassiliicoccaceae archaeon]|nr:DUF4376 domain-containing protein [Methanomassiliicoccaceae archaeon]
MQPEILFRVGDEWRKCETIDDFRLFHSLRISREYLEAIQRGRVSVTAGGVEFRMPITDTDIARLDGAIRYNEATGVQEMYITDADNITHYGLTIDDAKSVLLAMMQCAYGLHARKQAARKTIAEASTVEEMEVVTLGDI